MGRWVCDAPQKPLGMGHLPLEASLMNGHGALERRIAIWIAPTIETTTLLPLPVLLLPRPPPSPPPSRGRTTSTSAPCPWWTVRSWSSTSSGVGVGVEVLKRGSAQGVLVVLVCAGAAGSVLVFWRDRTEMREGECPMTESHIFGRLVPVVANICCLLFCVEVCNKVQKL